MPKAHYKYRAVGKRKTSIARIYMNEGEGKLTVNERGMEDYFPVRALQLTVKQPFELTETAGKFDVKARIIGGGVSGQAQALRHGIARALMDITPEYRAKLKEAGLLTRDARKKERKKYGQPGARKRYQYSKR